VAIYQYVAYMPEAIPARGRRACPPLVGVSGGKPAATITQFARLKPCPTKLTL